MKNFFKDLKEYLPNQNKKKIEQIIENIVRSLKLELNLEPLNTLKFNFHLKNEVDSKNKTFFTFGITERIIKENQIFIDVSTSLDLSVFIILREIYSFAFVPIGLREKEVIQLIIHQIILNDLRRFENFDEYNEIAKKFFLKTSFSDDALDRIDKFLNLKEQKKFIFNFLRNNYQFLKDVDEALYLKIFNEFQSIKSDTLIPNDKLIETIRILVETFYNLERFDSLKNYKNYFNKKKKESLDIDHLSLRKFSEKLQYLRRFHYLAPSYLIKWTKINIKVLICNFEFADDIQISKIIEMIRKLPFFLQEKISLNSSYLQFSSFVVIPEKYLDEFFELVKNLDYFGYLTERDVLVVEELEKSLLNLNYFREFNLPRSQIINPSFQEYDKKYELAFNMNYKVKKANKKLELSLLEFLILDRIRFISITGFGFERKREILQDLKSDLIDFKMYRSNIFNKLIKNIKIIFNKPQLRKDFIEFLKSNKKKSFFSILEFLEKLQSILRFISKEINDNKLSFVNQNLIKLLETKSLLRKIEEKQIFDDNNLKKIISKYYFPPSIKDKKEFFEKIKKIDFYIELLSSFQDVKIFKLEDIIKIIEHKDFQDDLLVEKLNEFINQNLNSNEISINSIENIINDLLKEDIIKPCMINTIFTSTFTNYFPQLLIEYDPNLVEIVEGIIKFFPRVLLYKVFNPFRKKNYFLIIFYIPSLNNKEKKLFVSILYNLFGQKLKQLKRYFHSGILRTYSLIGYYNFPKKEFCKNQSLFREFFSYVKDTFTEQRKSNYHVSSPKNLAHFWSKEQDIYKLVGQVKKRIYKENVVFNPKMFRQLKDLHLNLNNVLVNKENFMELKKKDFFKNFIKSISFIPNFQKFGISQYYLYISPENLDELDFKLLFLNSFQDIKYPAEITSSIPLFIKYFFPYQNPNTPYLNWLSKSKRSVREYLLFYVKKSHLILNFNRNIEPYGWYVDYKQFKTHIDNVLFKRDDQINIERIKQFNIGEQSLSEYKGSKSEEFINLLKVYGTESADIKTLTSVIYKKEFKIVKSLLREKYIFPFLDLKNLDLKEIIYVIAPKVQKKHINKLLQIFNFFNYGFIYEIAGEYFKKANLKESKFENGIMVELHLPGNTQIGEFFKLFDLLFLNLDIDYYVILHDLVDGKTLIRSIYEDKEVLKNYNPLKNLIWSELDKKWMNHKIYDESFNPIYPDLNKQE